MRGCDVSSFILRNIDPEFWQRVQQKAAAEGTTVKALILKLLGQWLVGALVLFTIGCADKLPEGGGLPPTPTLQPQAGVPARIELNGSPNSGEAAGTGSISAKVLDAFSSPLSERTVTFVASEGTLAATQVA